MGSGGPQGPQGGPGGPGGPQFHQFGFGDAESIFAQFFQSRMFGEDEGMPGFGMFGEGRGGPRMGRKREKKDPAIHRQFPVSLEDLYSGATKRLKITKKIFDESGAAKDEEKVVEINLKPGWKAGTKITYEREGDVRPGHVPADIVFILEDKPHALYRRHGADLVHRHDINLSDALCGVKFNLNNLDGKTTTEVNTVGQVVTPETKLRFVGKGMPLQNQPGKFGELHVEFNVHFPRGNLTDFQKQKIREANL